MHPRQQFFIRNMVIVLSEHLVKCKKYNIDFQNMGFNGLITIVLPQQCQFHPV